MLYQLIYYTHMYIIIIFYKCILLFYICYLYINRVNFQTCAYRCELHIIIFNYVFVQFLRITLTTLAHQVSTNTEFQVIPSLLRWGRWRCVCKPPSSTIIDGVTLVYFIQGLKLLVVDVARWRSIIRRKLYNKIY